jgi:hypothetical protein
MARRDHFKSSFGAFTSQQRELERARANRDERDAADAATETATDVADVGDATESVDDAVTPGEQSQDTPKA